MARPSKRVILWPDLASKSRMAAEPTSITRSIVSKLSGVMVPKSATGSPSTIQMLKILLPMMLPRRSSVSFLLAALMVVTSSGKEVPIAMIVSEIRRSDTPIALAIVEAELTTS